MLIRTYLLFGSSLAFTAIVFHFAVLKIQIQFYTKTFNKPASNLKETSNYVTPKIRLTYLIAAPKECNTFNQS